MLVGYLGEPVFRIDRSGLWVNDASATAVVLKLLKRSDRVVSAAPRWRFSASRRRRRRCGRGIVAIGAGLAAAGLGGLYYLESAEQAPDGGSRLSRAA